MCIYNYTLRHKNYCKLCESHVYLDKIIYRCIYSQHPYPNIEHFLLFFSQYPNTLEVITLLTCVTTD